jgi:hypothetical protein
MLYCEGVNTLRKRVTMTPEEAARRAKLAKILRLQELHDQTAEIAALTPAERRARPEANIAAYEAAKAEIEAGK